jgi:DNA polymerase I
VSAVFRGTVVCDFEYEAADGDLPHVLCMVAYVLDHKLRHVRTVRLWRGEFGTEPPFDIGLDTLFVAYSAWAELTCFMTLGWKFPEHVFDLHTAYLAASNELLPHNPDEKRKKPSKRLPDACRAYGIAGWELIDKETMAKDIGEGRWQLHGQPAVFDYCEEDVKKSTELLHAMLRGRGEFAPSDVARVLHWSNYSAKAIARIQTRGMPIDMRLWNLVQENKQAVVAELLRQFDPSHGSGEPIYDGEGHWADARFERHLVRIGCRVWPRLDTGKLDLDGDAFRLMHHVPGMEGLHALRDSLRLVVTAKLPIGRDGRNRPSLFPFCTTTGRNAHRRSLYNVHAGMRSFMRFPDDKIGVYLDWRTQEVGVVAALSGDPALLDAYRGGDVYHALAFDNGLTKERDIKVWKAGNPTQRQRMKALQLGLNYGMGVPALAKGLDRHPLIASGFIERHRRTYSRFWEWREQYADAAMLARSAESVFGWRVRLTTSPNRRTIYNHPAQSGGAEMLRLAAVWLCEAHLVPSMLVHDGILLELDSNAQIDRVKEIMRKAGRETCNGLEIGVDVDQELRGGARYRDKRPVAKEMWETMVRTLQTIGALPEEEIE